MFSKLSKGKYLDVLLRSSKTVFSFKEVALLWGEEGVGKTRVRLNNYVKTGKLIRIQRGLYAKDNNYDKRELATKIYTPSYISFETVLGSAGVTFQYYSQIFLASYLKREVTISGQKYSFKRLKSEIISSAKGVKNEKNFSIATPERAFLDIIYTTKHYHFDNLRPLNWKKVYEILPIYGGNKRMEKTVEKLRLTVK